VSFSEIVFNMWHWNFFKYCAPFSHWDNSAPVSINSMERKLDLCRLLVAQTWQTNGKAEIKGKVTWSSNITCYNVWRYRGSVWNQYDKNYVTTLTPFVIHLRQQQQRNPCLQNSVTNRDLNFNTSSKTHDLHYWIYVTLCTFSRHLFTDWSILGHIFCFAKFIWYNIFLYCSHRIWIEKCVGILWIYSSLEITSNVCYLWCIKGQY
jgi:hypothetical protein